MAKVKPFKAIRTSKEIVNKVTTRSYDTYTKQEIKAELNTNPHSFLHIIQPFFNEVNYNSLDEKFDAIKKQFQKFKEKGIYFKESNSVYYIYRKSTKYGIFIGIIAATSTKDYKNKTIKKHEKTIKKREKLFENYLKHTGFNAEPVLLTYPDNTKINTIITKYQQITPEYAFISENDKKHELWIIKDKIDIKKIKKEFKKIDSLYIADGHHRSASSYLLSKDFKKENKNYNYFLSYLISESNLKIAAFNRLVKGLNGLDKNIFLQKLEKHFNIIKSNNKTETPKQIHHFSMYLKNEVYLLKFKSKNYNFKSSLHHLDTHILNTIILKKILGIENARTDKRLSYASEYKGQEYLQKNVNSDKFDIAFGLFPVSIEQLKQISEDNLTMPPKSTYILPKLRSGLLIYEY